MMRNNLNLVTTDCGIPTAFLIRARENAVAIRQKVNEELIKRGVTTL